MKRKNGFTLIELLAVIVILAIIALIATPIVLNMINSARKSAAKSSALGFIDSVEYYAGFAQANGSGMDLGDYDSDLLPTTNTVCTKSNGTWESCAALMAKVEAKSKGKAPTDAQISIDTAGKVRNTSWVKYNDYYCVYDGSDITGDCTKDTPSNAEVATDSSSSTPSVPEPSYNWNKFYYVNGSGQGAEANALDSSWSVFVRRDTEENITNVCSVYSGGTVCFNENSYDVANNLVDASGSKTIALIQKFANAGVTCEVNEYGLLMCESAVAKCAATGAGFVRCDFGGQNLNEHRCSNQSPYCQ